MPSVLVIEEDRSLSEKICQLLRLLDVESKPVYTARGALLFLSDRIPDLIILDLHQLSGDAFQTLAALRRGKHREPIQVIAVAGADQPSLSQRAREEGIRHILPRPPSLEDIEIVLSETGLV
ncbi:MAG: response regulator [Chloroflexi bacterium]|nr:response regulator [Chloroflexota bacterium]